AADEAVRPVVEIVAVVLVDTHADRARGDERIEVELVLVEEGDRTRHGLVREVAPDLPLPGRRIVRLADAGEEEQLDVEQLERAEQHEVGRLLDLAAGG